MIGRRQVRRWKERPCRRPQFLLSLPFRPRPSLAAVIRPSSGASAGRPWAARLALRSGRPRERAPVRPLREARLEPPQEQSSGRQRRPRHRHLRQATGLRRLGRAAPAGATMPTAIRSAPAITAIDSLIRAVETRYILARDARPFAQSRRAQGRADAKCPLAALYGPAHGRGRVAAIECYRRAGLGALSCAGRWRNCSACARAPAGLARGPRLLGGRNRRERCLDWSRDRQCRSPWRLAALS